MKVSVIIPVYFNENTLPALYTDLKEKLIDVIDCDYELIFVDDGSEDSSWKVLTDLSKLDDHIRLYRLSRNFGSHAAILCGLSHCTGDCAVVKAADLQEPTELLLQMIERWKAGDKVVLACRKERKEKRSRIFWADSYYRMVRKFALKNMPEHGFDVFLVDRKVITVLDSLDEKNSALTCQILWSGFKTGYIEYTREARTDGTGKWTLRKKIKLVMDTLFSFTNLPIIIIETVGAVSILVSVVWAVTVLIQRLKGNISVEGWTTLFLMILFGFGIIMMSLGILGEYLWRTFDASRNRPPYIVETEILQNKEDNQCGKT